MAQTLSNTCLYSFRDITLDLFIQCLLHAERALLVKSGPVPSVEVLEDAWIGIYSEYCAAIGGIQMAAMIQRVRQANRISSRIKRIKDLVEMARLIVADELIAALADEPELKVNAARLSSADDTVYQRELDAVLAKLRPERLKLDALAKAEDKKSGPPPTEQDFDDMRFEVGKYAGFAMTDSTLLKDYCTGVRKLQEHMKHLSKQHRHGKRDT